MSKKNEMTEVISDKYFKDKEPPKKKDQMDVFSDDVSEEKETESESSWNETAIDVLEAVHDVYVFIMIRPMSRAALTAWIIFFIQISIYCLVLVEASITNSYGSDFATTSRLPIPVGVNHLVHASQFIAIPVIVLVQTSLWESLVQLYCGPEVIEGQGFSPRWWLLSNLLRLTEGLLATCVTFLILVQSDNVLELFKEFTAITFVSSFDNVLFELARFHFLGNYMYIQSQKCLSIKYRKTNRLSRLIATDRSVKRHKVMETIRRIAIHPLSMSITILIVLYAVFISLVFLPQYDGELICQKLFLQMSDSSFLGASSRSGHYNLLKGSNRKDLYPCYRETKTSLEHLPTGKPTLVRFCQNIGAWVITQEYPEHQERECEEYFLSSEGVEFEQQFDLFGVSSFFTRPHDSGVNSIEMIYLTCKDQVEPHGNGEICRNIHVDERENNFTSVRQWSENFALMKNGNTSVKVYEKPVYINSKEDELVFYTGYRWVMTYSLYLTDYQKENSENITLSKYLTDRFHATWSNYEVGFFSEAVLLGSAQDTSTPAGLKWYEPTIKNNEKINQQVDMTRVVQSKFICAFCDDSNPCFYNGTCDNGTCTCTEGSSGIMCQVLPTSNGLCNEFFNQLEYSYDGGDCCIDTCKSGDRYSCGRDNGTGQIYVGYDTCKINRGSSVWVKNTASSYLEGLMVTHVSLSSNGRVMALIESIGRSVRVYDSDGSDWIMRGSIVTNIVNPSSDTVQVSCHDYFLYHEDKMFPVTVSILSDSEIKIFEWETSFWKDTTPEIPLLEAKKIELVNNGNSLGVLYRNQSFKLFEREGIGKQWYEVNVKNDTKFETFSLSKDGSQVAFAHDRCISLFNKFLIGNEFKEHCHDHEIKQIDISESGHFLAALKFYEANEGMIHLYDVRQDNLTETEASIRGVFAADTIVHVNDSGEHVLLYSNEDNKLHHYSLSGNLWNSIRNREKVQCASIASSAGVLVLFTSKKGSSDTFEKWHKTTKDCSEGFSTVRMTFTVDQPDAFKLILFDLEEYFEEESVWSNELSFWQEFGPYQDSEGMLITEKFCVNTTHIPAKCFVMYLQDLGLNGSGKPNILSLSVNGTVIKTLKRTSMINKYSNLFWLFENDCARKNEIGPITHYMSPDNHTSNALLHTECSIDTCMWEPIGSVFHGLKNQTWSRGFAFSADARILAVGQYYVDNETGQVGIFTNNGKENWEQLGNYLAEGNRGSRFGYKVAMSADGTVVAVGAHRTSDPPKNRNGHVYVYQLKGNKQNEYEWIPFGRPIIGSGEMDQLGYSVSLSASGGYLAISSRNETCHVQVFEFDIITQDWIKRGDCISENVIDVYVTISSIGSVVVIGARKSSMNGEKSGHVAVYRYNHHNRTWQRKGNIIVGEAKHHELGYFGSISADGNILAAGGFANRTLKVYKYDFTMQDWQQYGQDIIFGLSTDYSAMALSSSGNELVYSYDNVTRVRVFDDVKQIWLDTVDKIPSITYQGTTPQIIISPDATVVAMMGDDDLIMYQLKKNITNSIGNCQKDEALFSFNITTDQFPQDISWYVRDSKGKVHLGEKLSNGEDLEYASRQILRCLKVDETFAFDIDDKHGDGICCRWGKGSFTLEWDNETRLNSSSFKTHETICLSRNSTELEIFVINFEEYSKDVSWQLSNSEGVAVLRDDDFSLSIGQCIQSHECHTFRIVQTTGNGTAFNINYNGAAIHEQKSSEKFFFNKTFIGCNTLPVRNSLFELEFLSGSNPETFEWELHSTHKGLISKQNGILTEQLKFNYIKQYVSLQTDECLRLHLNDDDKGGTVYAVYWDGNLIEDNITRSPHHELEFGNCG